MSRQFGRLLPILRGELNNAWPRSRFFDNGLAPVSFDRTMRYLDREMRHMDHEFSRMHNELNSFFRAPFSSFRSMIPRTAAASHSTIDIGDYIVDYTDESGQNKQKLQLELDANGLKADDISVKTISQRLEIRVKRQHRDENQRVYQEIVNEVALPEGIQINDMSCKLHDNIVVIEAPYVKPEGEKVVDKEAHDIHITHE